MCIRDSPYGATKRVRGVPKCVWVTHAGAGAGAWSHEACEGCAEMSVGDACGRGHGGLRWSSLWSNETCE
eukprot:9359787-Pyramimonas_sp.AAC.1